MLKHKRTAILSLLAAEWISSPNGPNDNVNQLKALAVKLLGTPKNLKLLDGDTDVFGDGSVTSFPHRDTLPAINRC
jgi:N-acyl homoserine lactone hydrolase